MSSTLLNNISGHPLFALVDCNSFYVSCERVFNPQLKDKPVIVLSNNDGCTVARSNEAKCLGIKMGDPIFKIRDLVKKAGVYVFSSNYALYADMSARVMQVLSEFTPELEIYSIDEAFLNLSHFQSLSIDELAHLMRHRVKQYTGIPVSIGIASSKVLTKVANHLAKKNHKFNGVFNLSGDPSVLGQVLSHFPVEELWGIGKQSAEKLKRLGITTALQLRDAEEKTIQKTLTLVGRRIQEELRGKSCIPLETLLEGEQQGKTKKQIICSRSFGKPVFELSEIKEALATHTTRASERLRNQNSVCQSLQVFINTNPFKNIQQYFNVTSIRLLGATANTHKLITAAHTGLEKIYRPGVEYKKTGIVLTDIYPKANAQLNLFEKVTQKSLLRDDSLMATLDKINKKHGQDTVKFAACGVARDNEAGWKMVSENRSPCFTTRWEDLLKAR